MLLFLGRVPLSGARSPFTDYRFKFSLISWQSFAIVFALKQRSIPLWVPGATSCSLGDFKLPRLWLKNVMIWASKYEGFIHINCYLRATT